MQLPDDFGVIQASADDLQLFLEHLYFPSFYPYPPLKPRDRVDLSLAEDDAALPLFPTPDAAAIRQYRELDAQGKVLPSLQLLTLIHYFDAKRLWRQCIAVMKADGATPRHA